MPTMMRIILNALIDFLHDLKKHERSLRETGNIEFGKQFNHILALFSEGMTCRTTTECFGSELLMRTFLTVWIREFDYINQRERRGD